MQRTRALERSCREDLEEKERGGGRERKGGKGDAPEMRRDSKIRRFGLTSLTRAAGGRDSRRASTDDTICSKNGKVSSRPNYPTVLGFVVCCSDGESFRSPVRAKGKIDPSPLLATSPRLLVAAKVTEETRARALVYAVERPLGKEQSRAKLQTRDRGKRATGVEGSTSGRTKKLREIYRDCAGGPSSLKGTEERWRGRRKCQLKSRRVSR